jgi:hypothetical protein
MVTADVDLLSGAHGHELTELIIRFVRAHTKSG